ncbi:uncharacterized protein LOC111673843 isoform X2 [Orussus abietinus]|uniref:uncharacterized protein LOC111673843 isoform X2 n=1 Tax=Orussus abietinus TaxID=222816 RepID=UPI000626652A|nr:uncharacterized protein LOC111673843 isoform X2 [Orussus abietinus]
MQYLLVPFILASSINVDENPWKHGPEYTYGVQLNMVTGMNEGHHEYLGTRLITKMKCRPKEPDSLSCRYLDAKFTRLLPKDFDVLGAEPAKNATYVPFGIGPERFEVKFNERGIESFLVPRSIAPWSVDMFKLIASQLSVGTNLGRKEETFQIMENFTMGQCETRFKVIRRDDEDQNGLRKARFKLQFLPELGVPSGQILEVEKKRNLRNCSPRAKYFFGTRFTYGLVPYTAIDHLTSSFSRITLSESEFTSETVNRCDIHDEEDREKIGEVLDHIKIFLESIEPAKEELKEVPSPVTVGLIVKGPIKELEHYEPPPTSKTLGKPAT